LAGVILIACGGAPSVTVREGIVPLMRKVCDHQLDDPSEYWTWRNGRREFIDDDEWIRAVFYLGVMATWRTTGDERYLQATLDWAQRNEWLPGPRDRHADDHCIGQVYLELYDVDPQPSRIAGLRTTLGRLRADPRPGREEWSWSDALFMAGPTLAHLAEATGDPTYRQLLHDMWWDTVAFLYDSRQHLFYRDARFKPDGGGLTEEDGTPIFWSRGNGWVMAATVRVLQHLPATDPRRDDYVQLLRDMAGRVVELQQSDGGWPVSLLAPSRVPQSEMSGTALFCYALAWGLNEGILSVPQVQPCVERAWQALVAAVDETGRVQYVQKPGDMPRKVMAGDSIEFGSGVWLLAASEVARLAPLHGSEDP
jgi:rhamnogalacturonyl hydrolase YesR